MVGPGSGAVHVPRCGGVRGLLAAAISLLAAVAFTLAAGADAARGQALFEEKCGACHTIGGGDLVGPDLEGVVERLGPEEVKAFILAPEQVRPGTTMPNLGLTEDEALSLVEFLTGDAEVPPAEPSGTETAAPTEEPPPPEPGAAAPSAGDAAAGKDLFTGDAGFVNGGPACLSCHDVAGIGGLGGGTLGPDLTGAYDRYGGEEGLAGVLATVAFPTMVPIYGEMPLDPEEVANLTAFLGSVGDEERAGWPVGRLLLLGLGGAVALSGIGLVIWRRRLAGVRIPMVRRSTFRK